MWHSCASQLSLNNSKSDKLIQAENCPILYFKIQWEQGQTTWTWDTIVNPLIGCSFWVQIYKDTDKSQQNVDYGNTIFAILATEWKVFVPGAYYRSQLSPRLQCSDSESASRQDHQVLCEHLDTILSPSLSTHLPHVEVTSPQILNQWS